MFTYRITYLLGKIDSSKCPPDVLGLIFLNFDGSQAVTVSDDAITVTFDTEQTSTDLGPLVKVELI